MRQAARSGGCRHAGAPRICARDFLGRSCWHCSFECVTRFNGFCGAIEAREFFGREKSVRLDDRDHAVFDVDKAAIPLALFALKSLRERVDARDVRHSFDGVQESRGANWAQDQDWRGARDAQAEMGAAADDVVGAMAAFDEMTDL